MRREGGGEFVETLLEQELGPSRLSPQDRSLCQELAYGAVRWEKTLDWLIARKTYGKPQRPGLQVLLRLGLYQLFWLDRVPDHAAVHETVELAKKRGFIGQAGFINAVLRGYVREKETTRQLLDQLKQTEPATGFSHPDWLVARWTERWGADRAARLLDWNNTPPPTFARRNALKADAATLVKRWADEGVQFTPRAFDWVENSGPQHAAGRFPARPAARPNPARPLRRARRQIHLHRPDHPEPRHRHRAGQPGCPA